MRVMGLDVGEKTIGVAVSDAMGWTAQGVTVIAAAAWQRIWGKAQLGEEYAVKEIVVGLPRRTDGSYGPKLRNVSVWRRTEKDIETASRILG